MERETRILHVGRILTLIISSEMAQEGWSIKCIVLQLNLSSDSNSNLSRNLAKFLFFIWEGLYTWRSSWNCISIIFFALLLFMLSFSIVFVIYQPINLQVITAVLVKRKPKMKNATITQLHRKSNTAQTQNQSV